MYTWHEAAICCEELYGVEVALAAGYFVCPDCGEDIYEEDWLLHEDWNVCPICGFDFLEG